jgi:enamidase
MSVAIVNIGDSHAGDAAGTPLPGDALVAEDGRIAWIGDSADVAAGDHEQVIDAAGTTVIPGLIDSHVHTVFGDWTPRQGMLGFLESYLHGGTTRVISASEVHVPGRPSDPTGVKALAIAAQRCFADFRPGGVTVHGGSVILEPTLTAEDFRELRDAGVWMAKAGFGAFDDPMDYVPVVHAAKDAGLLVMSHTGGGSIPGSQSKISADVLLAMRPHVAGHVNGGPTALEPEENARMVEEGDGIALQISHAGNLASALDIADRALKAGAFERLLISTDTPTGSGVISLGMLRQMAEMASLGSLSARQVVSAATGNVGAVYGLEAGLLDVGRPADLLVMDAPVGSRASDALGALDVGDLPAISVAMTEGVVRFTRSRNTPAPQRPASVQSAAVRAPR